MKISFSFSAILLLLAALTLNNQVGTAQERDSSLSLNSPAPAYLIPMGKQAAFNRMFRALNALGLQGLADTKNVEKHLTSGGGGYSYSQENPYLILSVDGFTGQIDLWRHVLTEADASVDVGLGNPKTVTQGSTPPNSKEWLQYLKDHGMDISSLSFSWYNESNKFTTLSLSQSGNFVNELGRSLNSHFDVSKANNEIYVAQIENIIQWKNTTPTITFDQAMVLANWLIEANDRTVLRAPFQFNAKQKQFWDPILPRMAEYTAYRFYASPRIEIRRDKWLIFRPEWNLNFGNFSIRLNAETGRPVADSYKSFIDSVNDPSSLYHVEEVVSHEKPDWYFPAQTEKLPEVIFNDEIVENERGVLHYPPIVREENPLIFADYFPNFLIETKREGDTITLRGQLPDKGKGAVLTLGSKEATVDGKPFTLSGAPQEIEGRLYLPYELLHECNGVLVRWDAKKNTLWVDTRYLRRP